LRGFRGFMGARGHIGRRNWLWRSREVPPLWGGVNWQNAKRGGVKLEDWGPLG